MPFGALRPSGRIRGLNNCIATACLIIMILALTGCGFLPFGDRQRTEAPAPPPAASQEEPSPGASPETAPETPSETGPEASEDAVPPDAQDGQGTGDFASVPVPAESLETIRPFETYPGGSLGTFGLNLENYLGTSVDIDEEEKLNRLEKLVLSMHRDMKRMAPPIQRLIAVEKDISSLVTQLQDFVQAEPVPPPQPTAPMGYPGGADSPPVPVAEPPPPAPEPGGAHQSPPMPGSPTIRQLRIGEHKDKTRIVLDVSGPATYRHDLDNSEHLLLIEVPEAAWSGATREDVKKSPLISSYSVHPINGGGSRIIVQLKKDTSVIYETVIRPNGKSFYRFVLDLKK